MEIQLTEGARKGSTIAKEKGKIVGRMTFTIPSDEYIIIDHTEIEPLHNGKGLGKKLLYKVVEMARERNIEILPTCPYAKKMFQKLTDIQDVLKK